MSLNYLNLVLVGSHNRFPRSVKLGIRGWIQPGHRLRRAGSHSLVLICLAATLCGMVVLSAVSGSAAATDQSREKGRAIFQEKCAACHTIGQGDRAGPDLKGITSIREHDWLTRWLLAPDKMIAEKDPIIAELFKKYNNIPMPNQGFTETEVAALLAYLGASAEAGYKPAGPPAAAPVMPSGDAAVGNNLFSGNIRFQNGAPPCIACHNFAGVGALGGGAMGPDITLAYNKFGQEGIISALATMPFPTMNVIYKQRPLTPEEQAHLGVFIKAKAAGESQRPNQVWAWMMAMAVVGAGLLFVLGHIIWQGRLNGVRRPLVRK